MSTGDRPPSSDRKRCATMGRSRAKVGKFDWYSDSAGGGMSLESSSRGCFLVNLHHTRWQTRFPWAPLTYTLAPHVRLSGAQQAASR